MKHQPQLCDFFRDLAPLMLRSGQRAGRHSADGTFIMYGDEYDYQIVLEQNRRDPIGVPRFRAKGALRADARRRYYGKPHYRSAR